MLPPLLLLLLLRRPKLTVAAQHYSQLCALLVEDAYGELSSQVFTTLSLWGRLSLAALTQHSPLSPRHTRYGLTVLIQQHLVLHSAPDSDEQCFYEVDWAGAYNLVRTGKIVKIVEDRFGESAGLVISNLLQQGHARIGDLEDAYKFTSTDSAAEHTNGEGPPNGIAKSHLLAKGQVRKVASSAQLHSVLYKLLQSGFITRVSKRTYLSAADASNEAETVVKREQFPDGKVSGPKAKIQFVNALNTLKRKWRDEADNTTAGVSHTVSRGMNGHGPAAKRQRTNGGMANGVGHYGGDDDEEDSGVTLERSTVIKVNYEKCNVALRSQALERQVARSIGETTAKVYSALLVLLERKVARCYDDLEEYAEPADEEAAQPSSTTLEITDIIDPSVDLSSTIATVDDFDDFDEDDYNDGHVKREKTADREVSSLAARNKRMGLIEQHMAILAEHPHGFATKISTRGKGEWRVNFPALVRWLQRNEIESVINTRFGSVSTRIVRMLSAKGKLDEKQVASFSLLRQKDIRSILTEMHEAGFVEAQEVPKDNSRQPSRALYLWYFDPERCKQQLLSNTYKAQARLIQRMQFEKDEVQHSIQKAERLDVVGHEDEILGQVDKQVLRQWREYEEKLLTQLARQDDLVALLRDFLPETTPS
ncbi:hypothetical protein MBLNU459_g3574t1 [Dothideomycetes sp. NU459]